MKITTYICDHCGDNIPLGQVHTIEIDRTGVWTPFYEYHICEKCLELLLKEFK